MVMNIILELWWLRWVLAKRGGWWGASGKCFSVALALLGPGGDSWREVQISLQGGLR